MAHLEKIAMLQSHLARKMLLLFLFNELHIESIPLKNIPPIIIEQHSKHLYGFECCLVIARLY
jgi:hypothetical protein